MYATMIGTGHTTPKLGLDLQGGTTVTLNPRLAHGQGKPDTGAINQAVDVIRNRVNGLGVAGANVVRAGNRIEISVPGKGREQVLNLVGTTAELRFRQVLSVQPGTAVATSSPSASPSVSPSAAKSASPSAAPKPSASAKTQSTSAPAASPTASKRVLSQGLLAATTSPTPAPSASTTPKAAKSAAPAASLPTKPSQCVTYSRQSSASSPSPYTQCLFATITCPEFKPDTANEKPTDWIVACDRNNQFKYLLYPARLVGTDVKGATATIPQTQTGAGEWTVDVSFTGSGQKKFTQLTKDTVNAQSPTNQVAIVLDGIVQSAPVTQSVIPGDASISGSFTHKKATADFGYARLHGDKELYTSGYTPAGLADWTTIVRSWTDAGRDAYVYFDNDVKVHAPFDAIALADLLRVKTV